MNLQGSFGTYFRIAKECSLLNCKRQGTKVVANCKRWVRAVLVRAVALLVRVVGTNC